MPVSERRATFLSGVAVRVGSGDNNILYMAVMVSPLGLSRHMHACKRTKGNGLSGVAVMVSEQRATF
jgi:hypothetical protein